MIAAPLLLLPTTSAITTAQAAVSHRSQHHTVAVARPGTPGWKLEVYLDQVNGTLVAFTTPTTTTTTTEPPPPPATTTTEPPPPPATTTTEPPPAVVYGSHSASGEASWYYQAAAGTCASPSLPFGTEVKVVNDANGDYTVCEVEDRGPYADSRLIDLSEENFSEIAPLSQGVAQVTIYW